MGAIRLILALSVALSHFPIALHIGVEADVAVELFFIISGFYISLVLDTSYSSSSTILGEPSAEVVSGLLDCSCWHHRCGWMALVRW